jgi:diguanylate cyclase (GGDEF)-like protein/PAS domain S-box-containing protein
MMDELLIDMLDNVMEGVYFVDESLCIHYWNKSAERITGYSLAEVFGKRCSDNLLRHVDAKGTELCLDGCPLTAARQSGLSQEAEVFLHHKDGHRVPISVRAIPYRDAEGKTTGVIEVFSDRSERNSILAELEELRKESFRDALTGLGNRRYFAARLEPLLRDLDAEGKAFGLLMLDLDNFKLVNDGFGHAVGDQVLRMAAATLDNAVRRGDIAVRWGGEELAVLAPAASPADLAEISERIRALVERSWIDLEDGRKVSVTVSVGGAVARPGDDEKSLVSRADAALYECKRGGRNRCKIGD